MKLGISDFRSLRLRSRHVVGDSFGSFGQNRARARGRRSSRCSARLTPSQSKARHLARGADRRRRAVARADALFDCCPISRRPALRDKARRAAHGEDSLWRVVTPRCDAVLQNSPAQAAPRRFRRSVGVRCSRALFDFPSHMRRPDNYQTVRLRALMSSASATAWASPRPSLPNSSTQATSSRSMCRRPMVRRCRRPEDSRSSMIGRAPASPAFRAFLLDRRANGRGPARIGFLSAIQRSDCDFFYADELNSNRKCQVC